MLRSKQQLTKSEEDLMEIFWSLNTPLTSVDILANAENQTWNGNYVHSMIRSMLKKGMIKECGTVRYGKQYARQFVPLVGRNEYAAKLAISAGINNKDIGKVAVAMVKETGNKNDEELIEALEELIQELKDSESKEK